MDVEQLVILQENQTLQSMSVDKVRIPLALSSRFYQNRFYPVHLLDMLFAIAPLTSKFGSYVFNWIFDYVFDRSMGLEGA